jgi:hypothetical protein
MTTYQKSIALFILIMVEAIIGVAAMFVVWGLRPTSWLLFVGWLVVGGIVSHFRIKLALEQIKG